MNKKLFTLLGISFLTLASALMLDKTDVLLTKANPNGTAYTITMGSGQMHDVDSGDTYISFDLQTETVVNGASFIIYDAEAYAEEISFDFGMFEAHNLYSFTCSISVYSPKSEPSVKFNGDFIGWDYSSELNFNHNSQDGNFYKFNIGCYEYDTFSLETISVTYFC